MKEIIFNRTELKAAFCILHRAIERRDFHSTENHFRTHYVEKAQLDCYMIDFILHNRYLFIDKDTEWWRVAATALDVRVFDGASCLARGIATVNQDDFHLTTTHDLDAFTFSRRGVNRLTFDLFKNIMLNRDLHTIGKYYPSCDNLSGKFKITHKNLIDKIFNFIKGDSIMTDTTINNSDTANTDSVSDTNTAQVQKVTGTSQAATQTISDTITSYDDITAQNADFVNTKFDSDSSYTNSVINNDLISTADAAEILGVTPRTVAKWRERKLFGVPFFTADEKRGDTWYYYRERVEQLKEVYQKGILQNMYKLARKFEGVSLSDYFQKPGTSGAKFSLSNFTPHFYPADEVAQILGVSERTIQDWTENKKIVEDMTDHEGMYWYAADRVFAFKAKLNKPKQQLDNLPVELVTQARWFKVLADKTPITNAWSKTDNQKLPDDITLQSGQLLGFDTVGHGKAADYLVLDFDHVLDDDGNFVNATAEDWYNTICLSVETFCEKSISGHGLHFIFKPNDGEFSTLSASNESTLHFDDEKSKIEIFYKTGARYFLFTGDNYYCDPKTPIATDCSIVHDILKEISGRNSLNQQANDPTTNSADDISHAREMLKFIDCAACTYDDWLKIGMALKTNGNPIDDWLDWSKTDSARYDEKTCCYKWNSFKRQELTIATIAYFAIQGGYKPARTLGKNNSDSLTDELKKIQAKLDDFEKEKTAAIELLKNLESFDSKTVFSDEVITAAAFAKLFAQQSYSDFIREVRIYGDKNRAEKAMLNDLKSAVKDKTAEITERLNSLNFQLNQIKGTIKSNKFIAVNPDLQDFKLPDNYSISMDGGIDKIIDDSGKTIKIGIRPIIISRRTKNVDEKTFKVVLDYWTISGKRKSLEPVQKSIAFNSKKIVDLADRGLPVSSTDAYFLTGYLNAFDSLNDDLIPQICTVPKCGWYDFGDGDIFVDPRRNNTINDDDNTYPLTVDFQSQFARSLTTKGDLSNWIQAYHLAKKSIVARCIVAAAVAPPLLKLLGERNFLLYIQGKTRAGKTTSLYLAASTLGTEKVIRSFDATRNGLLGAAADISDCPFLVDERQVADSRLKDQFDNLIYALANGIGRTKLNKDSTVKDTAVWRTIAIMTGETPLLDDNVSGGAFTRLISIRAPQVILPADNCKRIRDIIKDHYGLVIPLMLDKILSIARADLLKTYDRIIKLFSKNHSDILPEHRRYIAVVTLADCLLNVVLGMDSNKAYADSLKSFDEIFEMIPTQNDIEDSERETAALFGFITQYQNYFIATNSKTVSVENVREVYGKDEGDFIFITVNAMKIFCKQSGFNYDTLIDDLTDNNVIIPSSRIKAGHTTPLKTHQKKLGGVNTWCFKLKKPADETTKEKSGGFNDSDFAGDYVPDYAVPFD